MKCQAVYKSGARKGQTCNNKQKPEYGNYCGVHKSYIGGGSDGGNSGTTESKVAALKPLKIAGLSLSRVIADDCCTLKKLSDDAVLNLHTIINNKNKKMNIGDRQYVTELIDEHCAYKVKCLHGSLQHLPAEFENWTKLYEFITLNSNLQLVKLYLPLLRISTLSPKAENTNEDPPHSYITIEMTETKKIPGEQDETEDDEEPTEPQEISKDYTLIVTAHPNGLWNISSKTTSDNGEKLEETTTNVSTAELLSNLKNSVIHEVSID